MSNETTRVNMNLPRGKWRKPTVLQRLGVYLFSE